MLNAYWYRLRKGLLKKPITIVIAVVAILFSAFMLKTSSFISSESDMVRDPMLIVGAFNLIWILIFDAVFLSGLAKGVTGFSFADINFHLAGPFSSRFNLIIAGMSTLKMVFLLIWIILCQTSLLVSTLLVNGKDMLMLLLILIPVLFAGCGLGSYMGAKIKNSSKVPAYIAIVLFHIATIGVAIYRYIRRFGGISEAKSQGVKSFIKYVGGDEFTSAFPVAGWAGMIYRGMSTDKNIYIVIGAVLLVISILSVILLFAFSHFDYYEDAIEMSQRVNDLREAKKAGIDTDHAAMNRRVKVGKETLNKGWGSSVFFHRHLLENKRQSRFYFVNSLAVLYRIIAIFYLNFMSFDFGDTGFDDDFVMVEAMIFFMLLNVMVFGGGKTVFEFNRPYLFMVPEKASQKLLACILSEIPEMTFDAVICGVLMCYFTHKSVDIFLGTFIFMIVYDVFSELCALILLRVLRGLGQYTLMIVRYLVIYAVSVPVVLPAIVLSIIFESQILFFAIGAATIFVINIILLFVARYLIDNADVA